MAGLTRQMRNSSICAGHGRTSAAESGLNTIGTEGWETWLVLLLSVKKAEGRRICLGG